MKNIRKFEMIADKDAAVLEDVSIVYVNENDKVYTTPENGEQGGDTVKNYMRFVAVEDSQIKLNAIDYHTWEYVKPTVNLMINKNMEGWIEWDFTPIPLAAGETLYLKGDNQNGFSVVVENWTGVTYSFGGMNEDGNGSTGKFECHGNIMSLLYSDEFEDKTTIPNAYCFSGLFADCSSLTTAPKLPATTLAYGCYDSMFYACKSLTNAPELQATTLADECYYNMFSNCTNLTTAPELPATTLAEMCYGMMFNGCTSLTTAPSILPATTLAGVCYNYMFVGCTSLTTAPELPATKLATACYNGMFAGCASLTTVPELPATILDSYCYCEMFYNCTSLTTAPELHALELTEGCYDAMFAGCTSLNHITMLATNIPAYRCLYNWVRGVSSTGTFVKHPNMTSLPTGTSGIPEGWTVEDAVLSVN